MQNSQSVSISHYHPPVSAPEGATFLHGMALQTYDVVGLRRGVIGVGSDLVPETLRPIAGHPDQDLESRTAADNLFHGKYVA